MTNRRQRPARPQPRESRGKAYLEKSLLVLGILLLVVTPPVALLPGPGGTITFIAGLGLVLRFSSWAKRRYVHFKRRWPRWGHFADRGLRRPSTKRRIEQKKRVAAANLMQDPPPPGD